MRTSLKCRNVSVNGRRTSIRIHHDIWGHIDEICAREALALNLLCSQVDDVRGALPLTEALRIYTLNYWRDAASRPPRTRSRSDAGRQAARSITVSLSPTLLAGLRASGDASASAAA